MTPFPAGSPIRALVALDAARLREAGILGSTTVYIGSAAIRRR